MKKIGIHLGIMLAVGLVLILIFFYYFLPTYTNHGETITVPNVIGVQLDQLDEFLIKRDLRFEVTEDSAYSSDYPPLSVIKQVPLPNAKVKENLNEVLSSYFSDAYQSQIDDLKDKR